MGKEQIDPAKAVVKKVTKGHEVMEVDGFVFKRKRKASEQAGGKASSSPRKSGPMSPASQATGSTQASGAPSAGTPSVGAATPASPAAAAAAAAAAEPMADAAPETVEAATAVEPAEPPAPAYALGAGELEGLLQGLLCAEIGRCGALDGGAKLTAVRGIAAAFKQRLAAHYAQQQAQEGAPAAAPHPPQLAAALHALRETAAAKAALGAKLQRLAEEEEEWSALEGRYGASAATASAAAGAADAAATGGASAIGGEVTAAAAANAENALAAGSAAENAAEGAAATAVEDGEAEQAGAGQLATARAEADQLLTLQVESLSAMVGTVEGLVGRAEAAAALLQAEYHRDKFRVFAHVNSPAWLIRHLIKSDAADGAGASPDEGQQ